MKFEDQVKKVLEAVYVPKTSSISLRGSALEDEEVKVAAAAKILEHFKKLKQLVKKAPDSPEVRQFTLDTFNLIKGFNRDSFIFGKDEVSKEEILKNLLEVTKTPKHDYKELAKFTIDELKEKGFDMDFYHLYERILGAIAKNKDEFDTLVKGRSRREDVVEKAAPEPIYYFGKDGNPYRTEVFVPRSGILDKVFWATNKYKYLNPENPNQVMTAKVGDGQKPQFTLNGEEQKPRFTPSKLRGKTLEEIRNAVNHEEAKKAYMAKWPLPKYEAFYRSGPKGSKVSV